MRITVVILAVGLVAVAAGCGGGGSKSPSSTSTQMHETTTSQATTTGSGSVPSFASAKNCQDLAGLAAKVASSLQVTSGNPATALDTYSQELQGLANAAPSAIRADFQTFASAFSSYLHSLEKAGYKPGAAASASPSAAQIAALTKAAKVFETPKLMQAEQHLNAWVHRNCKGVKLGG
jgi:hypothetical protein